MRNHPCQQHQQHKENIVNSNNNNNINNNNNNNTNSTTNRYQYCLLPVMAATTTANATGSNTGINNHSTTTTIINSNNNTNTSAQTTTPLNNSTITNDTLTLQIQPATKICNKATVFNTSKTKLSTSSSTSPSSSSSSSSNTMSSSSPLLSGSTTTCATSLVAPTSFSSSQSSSLSSSSVTVSLTSAASSPSPMQVTSGVVAPVGVALTKHNDNDQQLLQHHHHHHHHLNEQINNNNNSNNNNNNSNNNNSNCTILNDSRKSISSTTKSFNNNNNNNSNNNNNNNNHNNNNNNNKNCHNIGGNNNFPELMQRNKRLSPTQESSNMSFSSASVAGSIQDDISDQCGLTKAGLEEYTMRSNSFYDNPVLYHHQKQSSYAQSEGYHSYVSSSDSTSATPMLDRLRQESELLSRQTSASSSHHWSQNDLSSLASPSVAVSPTTSLLSASGGRDLSDLSSCTQQQTQQHNNSSESTSSTETLKWLGSMSDVSEVSHATGFSSISESVSTSQLIVHSSRVLTPKRHQSESVLFPTEEQIQQQQQQQQHLLTQHHDVEAQHSPSLSNNNTFTPNHRHSPSYPPIHQTSHTLYRHQHNHQFHTASPELSKPLSEKTSSQTTLANCDKSGQKSNISVTISSSEAVVTISPQPPPVPASKPNSNGCKDAIVKNSINPIESSNHPTAMSRSHHGVPRQNSSLSMTGNKSVSASMDSLADIKHPYRNNHRLFPVSTYTEPVHSNTSHFVHHPKPQYSTGLQKPQKSPTAASTSSSSSSNSSITGSHTNLHQPKLGSPNFPQPSWQSVAALINDFERGSDQQQQPQKYTYLDPNKTHRVPNPALKAFQKNAVQSYFERQQHQQHQQQQQQHAHSLDNLSPKSYHQSAQRPSSLQNSSSTGEVQTVLLRNSLPSNYNTSSGQRPLSEDKNASYSPGKSTSVTNKPPSPAPPPPPPRSRSMMPTLLRRSSSASDYSELRDQFITASQEKLQSQSIKNISNSEKFSFNDCGMPPPPPPPRGRGSMAPRRTSSAAEYAAIRDKVLLQQAAAFTHQQLHPHQHVTLMSNNYNHHATHHHPHSPHHHHYQTGLPMPPVPHQLQDGWVPERPPKNPNLRVPSPDLPPPPPGLENESTIPDEPLPPPPPEILQRHPIVDNIVDAMPPKPPSPNRRNSFAGASIRKSNFFNRSASSTENSLTPSATKGPPPLIPRKPAGIELLQVSRPSQASLNQLQQISTKPPPELTRATIISSSTRKRPHNLAASTPTVNSITSIQENCANLISRHSPTGNNSPLHSQMSTKCSPPPPPLMPRMPIIVQQTPQQQQQQQLNTSNSNSNISNNININTAAATQKSRCNSKASYLPRQSLEKQSNSDPDHGSYKMTLHSNEDLVTTTKSSLVTTTKSSYDILAQTPKLPNNLPDVLPLGAKLQPCLNTSLNSTPSLRYGSNNNISSQTQTSQQSSPVGYTSYSQQQQQQQRYSTPVLSSFNLSTNFTRSQSFDTNAHASNVTQSPTKYMTQSSLDLKKPLSSLETTIEETNLNETSSLVKDNSSLSSLSSLAESCNSHEDRIQTNFNPSNINNAAVNTEVSNSLFRAELVNTTFNNSNSNSNNTVNSNSKKSVIRQESLRENIEKITQLQSQLMSAHISDNTFMASSAFKTSHMPVIDIPKTLPEIEKMDQEKPCLDIENEKPLAPSLGPVAVEEDSNMKTPSSANSNTGLLKSSTIVKEETKKNDISVLSQIDSSTDSLKLVQRSELILRVNPSTVETASQTDDITDNELKNLSSEVTNTKENDTPTRTTLQPRQRLSIENDCEKMSRELAKMLPPNDVLIHILCPPGTKTIADYVTNLYNPNVPLRPSKRDVGTSTLTRCQKTKEDQEVMEKVTVELKLSELEQTSENCDILKNKVDDLIKHLNNKVHILTKEQSCIEEESAINDELGNSLLNKLSDKVRPIEASKCRTYISDIGHITGLLLSLSERLARAENNLTIIDENNIEKKSLENKRDRLFEQLTEAKRLKQDIDRRGISVVSLLEKNLTSDEFADFEYFINMKAKLITDARDIADKIKIDEEIITALSDTLTQSDC